MGDDWILHPFTYLRNFCGKADLCAGTEFRGAIPNWFAGGLLAFSPDDQTLIYHPQWNDQVSIRLADVERTFSKQEGYQNR